VNYREIGTIRKNRRPRTRIAAVYPNTYHVGMSNLGFQTVYRLFNEMEDIICERAFVPDKSDTSRVRTVESGAFLSDFDIIAFSISYENDYPGILRIFDKARIPPRSCDRTGDHPLVIAGGVACFLNPEPIAAFIDCFLIGEAEVMLPRFLIGIKEFSGSDRIECLKMLAKEVPGVYVPEFYRSIYHKDGAVLEPLYDDVPAKIPRVYLKDLSLSPSCTAVLTPDTAFPDTFLIETARGCPHGCRFCAAGYVYRPPRFRPVSLLKQCMETGAALTRKIGLVGAAVSDLPGLPELCRNTEHIDISFSSLRADALTPEIVSVLKRNKVKTATIAPDAGSERMRRVINKGITEEHILNAADILVSNDIPNLKLYFMVGLPAETIPDVEAIIGLCRQIKQTFLSSSRLKKRIGEITVSLNAFVPKPFTPFQWAAMDDVRTLKKKITLVKEGLRGVANLHVKADIPSVGYLQALFSRGDRQIADLLSVGYENKGNWAKTLKEFPIHTDQYVCRERSADENFPWEIIAHGVRRSFLAQEYRKALKAETTAPCKAGFKPALHNGESCKLCGGCEKSEK